MLSLLRTALPSASQWLQETAYRQASKLRSLPPDVATWIRDSLIWSARSGRLIRQRYAIAAYLRRLPEAEKLLPVARLLAWAPMLDFILLSALLAVFLKWTRWTALAQTVFFVVALPLLVTWSHADEWYDAIMFRRRSLHRSGRKSIVFVGVVRLQSIWMFSSLGMLALWKKAGRELLHPRGLPLHHSALLQLLILLYCSFWALCAIWSAYYGDFVEIWWWPILPARPFLHFMNDSKQRRGEVQQLLGRFVRVAGKAGVLFLAFGVVIWGVIKIFSRFLDKHVKIVVYCFGILGALTLILTLGFNVYEWLKFLKWAQRKQETNCRRTPQCGLCDYWRHGASSNDQKGARWQKTGTPRSAGKIGAREFRHWARV